MAQKNGDIKNYSEVKSSKISDLPKNKNIWILLDTPFEGNVGYYPIRHKISVISDDLVQITPVDYLNTILETSSVISDNLSEPVKKVMELIKATQKTVKEYSTTEPSFDSNQLCKYSFTLKGLTIEDIFHQMNRMYFNIINQTSMDYSTLRRLYTV